MNVKIRKDSWTADEDKLLLEIIVQKIEQGLTQISGFEEASKMLGRSKQACAFRWNKNLRPFHLKKETLHKESPMKEVSDSPFVENYLQLAIKSYDEMKQSYEQITHEYNLLKKNHEELVIWVKQGISHIE